jgi:hypothetical protein
MTSKHDADEGDGVTRPDEPLLRDSDAPDVLLDVPKLVVEEIGLEVDTLHARISLDAHVADLIQLHVGADVEVARVVLEIKGVEAAAQLQARLENVYAIIDRALATIEEHPELVVDLAEAVGGVAAAAGNGVGELTRAVDRLGAMVAASDGFGDGDDDEGLDVAAGPTDVAAARPGAGRRAAAAISARARTQPRSGASDAQPAKRDDTSGRPGS